MWLLLIPIVSAFHIDSLIIELKGNFIMFSKIITVNF